jgi:copper(I)-binding protein
MRRIIPAAFLVAALSYGCGEQPPERVLTASKGHLAVYDAVATASAAPDVSSVYFTIVNAAAFPDTLFDIGTAAGAASLHTVVTDSNGVTRMQPLAALVIPAGSSVSLAPGGYHIMLTELRSPLEAGDSVFVALNLAQGNLLRFRVPVLTYTEMVERLEPPDHE